MPAGLFCLASGYEALVEMCGGLVRAHEAPNKVYEALARSYEALVSGYETLKKACEAPATVYEAWESSDEALCKKEAVALIAGLGWLNFHK